MGIIYIVGDVKGPTGIGTGIEFLVDSGTTYSLLAFGTRVNRAISECHITLSQGEAHTRVIIGEESDETLLGTVNSGNSWLGPKSN